MVSLSVLDQSPIRKGGDAAEALANTIELAKHADRLGYARYWMAEHHNTKSFAGSAPEVLIARIAAETSPQYEILRRLRAGSADRAHRGRNLPHSRRVRRRDAAALQPAESRGMFPPAGNALSGAHRSRHGARAGRRHAHHARLATRAAGL